MASLLDLQHAADIAALIQQRSAARFQAGTLKTDPVSIKTLPGNLFQLSSRATPDPVKLESYKYLKSIGAEISIHRTSAGLRHYTANVTWDSMVNYLIRTGELTMSA